MKIEGLVKKNGGSGHVIIPKKYIGQQASIYIGGESAEGTKNIDYNKIKTIIEDAIYAAKEGRL